EEERSNSDAAVTGTVNFTEEQEQEPKKELQFRGEITGQMRKAAGSKGLLKEEIAEIEQAANDVVNEALRRPGDLPNPSPQKYYSDACNVMVDGLPLIGSRQQRCCNVAGVQGLPPGMAVPPKVPPRD
ncbi:unnamed protein product, partial [Laminaria digitata]